MTIALGLLASDGIVIAADTQETYSGALKVNHPKISGALNGDRFNPEGVFIVTGAGSAVHLDPIGQELSDAFETKPPATIMDE